jgi:hypothetical protein
MKSIIEKLLHFEGWFNAKFGWFFTNGMKKAENQTNFN